MNAPPPCTAVLVNFHGAADIAGAVRSILHDAPDTEVIVVDNSADAVEHQRLREALPPGVRVLDAGENLGFGRACNLAWAVSRSAFVFFVNPDVRLRPGCIRALADALSADASLGAVAPRQFLDDDCQWHLPPAWLPTPIRVWSHAVARVDARAAARIGRAGHAENLKMWTATRPVLQRALSGAALMLRRSAMPAEEPPFDPRFFMYYEDSDLCFRLRRVGWQLASVPDAVAIHDWRHLPHKTSMMEASAPLYFEKHWNSSNYWLNKAATTSSSALSTHATGSCGGDPAFFDVPPAWQAGWVLEVGLNAILQPAVGQIGEGARACVPRWLRERLGTQEGFARLTPLGLGAVQACLRSLQSRRR